MSTNQADSNVKGWFLAHRLPWNDAVQKFVLVDQGVEVVEDLKCIPKPLFLQQFLGEKPVVKVRAKMAWKELGGKDSFQFNRSATTHNLENASPSPAKPPAKSKTSSISSHTCRANNGKSVLAFSAFGYSRKVTKTGIQKREEREARKEKRDREASGAIDFDSDDDDDDECIDEEAEPSAICKHTSTPSDVAPPSVPACNLLAIMPATFRSTRCHLSCNLSDPADENEHKCWGDKLLPNGFQCDDLEDPKKYYRLLGCSKASSDAAIADAFRCVSSAFKCLARTHHPDKAHGNETKIAKFTEALALYGDQKKAMEVLGIPNIYGDAYPKRADYDREGEALRDMFETAFKVRYPRMTFADRVKEMEENKKRAEMYARVSASRKQNAIDDAQKQGSLESVAKYYRTHGQQENRTRVSIYYAMKAGHTMSHIARFIRKNVYIEVSTTLYCVIYISVALFIFSRGPYSLSNGIYYSHGMVLPKTTSCSNVLCPPSYVQRYTWTVETWIP